MTNICSLLAKERDRPDVRELGDWSRKGPLPDLPNRGERRGSDRGGYSRNYGEGGSEFGGERRERREFGGESDGKVRDFGNWERKGPLSPLPQTERSTGPREGGRPRTNDASKGEGFRERRASPAAWGEGRAQGDGSRPPRREFQERTPTAAEQDNQWRSKMRPDAPAGTSSVSSREGSEAPTSPAAATAVAPGGRPRLNLAKRTVSETPDVLSPASVSGESKSNPFGGARPIDTAAKEREIEEKRLAALREKKEAEEKAREEKREAAKAAKASESEKPQGSDDAENDQKVEVLHRAEEEAGKPDQESQNGTAGEEKSARPNEAARENRPQRPVDASTWRRSSSGPKVPRDDAPRGGRGRGDGPPRGPRHDGPRPPRSNTNGGAAATTSRQAPQETNPETAALEEDGWSTVKQRKNQRGGQGSRAIAS